MRQFATLAILFCLMCISFGCSALSDSKRYEMKKSPCACIDLPAQNG